MRIIADTVIAIAVTIMLAASVVALAAEREKVEIRDHSCPDMPQDVLDARESADLERVRSALDEAIVFWEACRLGSGS